MTTPFCFPKFFWLIEILRNFVKIHKMYENVTSYSGSSYSGLQTKQKCKFKNFKSNFTDVIHVMSSSVKVTYLRGMTPHTENFKTTYQLDLIRKNKIRRVRKMQVCQCHFYHLFLFCFDWLDYF